MAKKTPWTHSPPKHPVMSDKPEALYIALVLSAFWLLLATPMTVVLVRFFGEIASGPSWPQYAFDTSLSNSSGGPQFPFVHTYKHSGSSFLIMSDRECTFHGCLILVVRFFCTFLSFAWRLSDASGTVEGYVATCGNTPTKPVSYCHVCQSRFCNPWNHWNNNPQTS